MAEADLNEKQLNQIIDRSDADRNKFPIPTEIKEVIYEPSIDMSEMKNGYFFKKIGLLKNIKNIFLMLL